MDREEYADGTTRWFGGLRSVGSAPKSDALWMAIRRERRASALFAVVGMLLFFGVPPLACGFAGLLEDAGGGVLGLLGGILPLAGFGMLLGRGVGWHRWIRVRRQTEVEHFAVSDHPQASVFVVDSSNGWLIAIGDACRTVPEKAKIIITAAPGPIRARPLTALEHTELEVVARYLTRRSWLVPILTGVVGAFAVLRVAETNGLPLPPGMGGTIYLVLAGVILVLTQWLMRRPCLRRVAILRDEAAGGLTVRQHRLVFPESGVEWQVEDRPSSLRMKAGGFGRRSQKWRSPQAF